MKRWIVTFGLVLALPLALSAQQGQQHRMQEMHEGQGMGMMQGHQGMGMMMSRPGPGMILQLRSTLELTDEQVQELETMHAAAHEEMAAHREAAAAARKQAHEAMMGASADLEAFQSALAEAAQHDVQATVAMARVHMQAGDVLTEEQTAKLHTLMQAMQEMHHDGMEGMQEGGMEHGEGMEHGGMEHRG